MGADGVRLSLAHVEFDEACAFVAAHHRHHRAPRGHKFSIAAVAAGGIVGVAIVGRPTARGNQDGETLELTRLATDGTRNACSFLYGASCRAAFALGYTRLGTYILKSEGGVSLRAAGWRLLGEVRGRSWNCPSRPRVDKHPLQDKLFYGAGAW